MNKFEEREKGFEAKFRFDQDFEFRVKARAVRLLGLWTAMRMGEDGTQANEYAHALVEMMTVQPATDLATKVARDLDNTVSAMAVAAKYHEMRGKARQELAQEYHGDVGDGF